jgi:hypothetical protein
VALLELGVALLGRAVGTQVGGAAERLLPIGTLGERREGFAVRGNAGLLAINAA